MKDFSLLGQNNVDETIENSKIIDPDLHKLTPIKTSGDDKFKDAADSFYVLDEERPEALKRLLEKDKKKSKKPIIKVTRRLTKEVRISQNKMLLKNANRTIGTMSFSPTIDTFGYVYANIFAEEGYTFETGPIPNYFRPIPAGTCRTWRFSNRRLYENT